MRQDYKLACKLIRRLIRNGITETLPDSKDLRILRSIEPEIIGKAFISIVMPDIEDDTERIKFDCQVQLAGSIEAYHAKQVNNYIKRNLSRRDEIPF